MSQNDAFFQEIFLPKEIDYKCNQNLEELLAKSSLVLLSEVPVEEWSERFLKMTTTIADLIKYTAEQVIKIDFQGGSEINQILQHSVKQTILCFTTKETLEQLSFGRNPSGFVKLNGHRIIFLPINEIFVDHKASKSFLWKALQEEFSLN